MTATDAPPRDLAGICEVTRLVRCGLCGQLAALACEDRGGTRGLHVSRFGRAYRRGLISEAEYRAVLCSVPLFTSATVIYTGEQT